MTPIGAVLFSLALLAPGVAAAQADEWPARPIRAVAPLAAGTGADVIARIVLNQLSVQLRQPIVIENKGGAGGTLGAAMVAKAEPDGYTLMAGTPSHTIAPAIYPNLPYDTARDFIAVVPFGSVPTALVVAPSKGVKTVQELVATAKAKPGSISYASAGIGSTTHLTAERFRLSAGFTAVHVPFRGGGFQPDVMAGRVDFAFSPVAVSVPNIRDNKLVALAVSGRKRATALPDVPTTLEAGYADSDYVVWVGLFVPAKTPSEIVARLHEETRKALQTPSVRERLIGLDVDPMEMTQAEFGAYVDAEIANNAALTKAVGIVPN
jgi:tripartite-type tricarboxylate transporter receptor subunit TctC